MRHLEHINQDINGDKTKVSLRNLILVVRLLNGVVITETSENNNWREALEM